MKSRIVSLLGLILSGSLAATSFSQIQLSITTSRTEYMLHEAIDVKLKITNLAGRPVFLRDTPDAPWLNFEVQNVDTGRRLPARRGRPPMEPLLLEAGQTVERTLEIGKFNSVESRGILQFTAQIFVAELERFFTSKPSFVTIGEGRKVWTRRVGIPGGAEFREYSLLSYHVARKEYLYLRVRDPESETVFVTRPIAPSLSFGNPIAEVDAESRLHALFLIGPKTYKYQLFDTEGRQMDQIIYRATTTRPILARSSLGRVKVVGGFADIPKAVPAGSEAALGPARLSERPAGLPES
jgi:hypothetical protein